MLNRVKGLFELNVLTGAELRLGQDGLEFVQACTLQLSGDRLAVQEQHTGLKNIAHFAKYFKPGPVAVCLSGKGILTRKIQQVTGIDQQVIGQVLPNANAADFYFQAEVSADHSVISIIRRSAADALIDELTGLGFQVVSVVLGDLDGMAGTGNIKPELGRAYYSAFQVLLGQELIEAESAPVRENRMQVIAKAKFMGIAALFGSIMLVLLLVNFLLFSHYEDEAARLSFKQNLSGMQVKKFRQMESDIEQKALLVGSAGWTGGYRYSWLTDRLMASRPAAVDISQLSINPLKLQKGMGREEIRETAKIRVSGTCDSAAALNNWLFEIKAMDWVKDSSILEYELNKESSRGQFTIDIEINDYEG